MSSYPSTYSAYRRSPGIAAPPGKRLTISLNTKEQLPSTLGPDDVIIKIHAISLNYRDLGTLIGNYPTPFEDGGIPCSDAAGEVVAVGGSVSEFAVGDRVMPITSIGERGDENEDDDGMNDNIGIESAGVLAEYVVFREKHLVRVPKGLGWEEVSLSLFSVSFDPIPEFLAPLQLLLIRRQEKPLNYVIRKFEEARLLDPNTHGD